MLKKVLIIVCVFFFLGSLFFVLYNSKDKQNTYLNEQEDSFLKDEELSIENEILEKETEEILEESNILEENNLLEKTYYFGYGSNMDLELLRRRINNNEIIPETYVILKDYDLIFPRGVGSVIPKKDTDVYGCLYLLTKEEIAKLDIIEGYKEGRDKSLNSYNREWIEVLLPSGESVLAEIYIQTNNEDTNSKPSNSYKQTLVTGANDCSLPDFYIQKLKNLETK